MGKAQSHKLDKVTFVMTALSSYGDKGPERLSDMHTSVWGVRCCAPRHKALVVRAPLQAVSYCFHKHRGTRQSEDEGTQRTRHKREQTLTTWASCGAFAHWPSTGKLGETGQETGQQQIGLQTQVGNVG